MCDIKKYICMYICTTYIYTCMMYMYAYGYTAATDIAVVYNVYMSTS